mgnify:CR=1 FL=1
MKKKKKKSGQSSIERQFKTAVNLQQDGEYATAIELYHQIIKEEPSHLGALMNLGVLYYAEGRNAEAVLHFDAVLEVEPQNADAHYNRGKALAAQSDLVRAELSFREALLLAPEDKMTLYEYCNCCIAADKPNQALVKIDAAPGSLRSDPDLVMLRAEALLRLGQFEEARSQLGDLVRRIPDLTQAFVLLAKVNFCAREFDRALTAMKRAVVAEPTRAEYQRELGIIYAIKGEREAAQGAFREARKMDPSLQLVVGRKEALDPDVVRHWDDLALQMHLMDRMRYWASRGEWRGAVNELLILNRKYAGRPCILQELGAAYQLNGEPKRARTLYRQLLERDPENLEALLQLNYIALDLNEVEEALKLSGKIVKAFPELAEGLTLRGRALHCGKREDEAERVLRKAITLSPSSRDAQNALGRLLLATHRYEEAADVLERAVRASSGAISVESLSALSTACRRSGDRTRLRKVLEDAVTRSPGSLAANVELARILLDCEMTEEARELYREATMLKASDNNEAILLAEAHLFCRSADEAGRIVRTLRRKFPQATEPMLFDALIQTMHGRASRDSIAWQRLWREAAALPIERLVFVRTVLTPNEQRALLNDLVGMKRLFSTSGEILSQMCALEDGLSVEFQS